VWDTVSRRKSNFYRDNVVLVVFMERGMEVHTPVFSREALIARWPPP